MKLSLAKYLSTNLKAVVAVAFILAVAAADYKYFLNESEKIELYDGLHSELSAVRVSVAKLEYTLDMFVAAKRFENTTVALIRRDVEQLDRSINDIFTNPRYLSAIKAGPQIGEGMESISTEWQTIKNEILRIKETVPQDELMLIHNSVDVNTILMNEMNDRVMGAISQGRAEVLEDIKTLALATSAGFVLVSIIAAALFYARAYYPALEASRAAEMIFSGNGSKRFNETGSGFMGRLAFKLNLMLAALNEQITAAGKKAGALEEALRRQAGQIGAVNALTDSISRALSLSDVLAAAVGEAVTAGGADGAWVYLAEDGFLRLKASRGVDDAFLKEGAAFALEAFRGMEEDMSAGIFPDIEKFPNDAMRPLLRGAGFSSIVSVPIRRDGKTVGYFHAAYREASADSSVAFFEAVALNIEGFMGYTDVSYRERNRRRFLERVIDQMPMGIAVFDRDGTCALANNHLKKLLNAHPEFNFAGAYSLLEDEAFRREDVASRIKNVYAGYTAEFTVEYAPSLTARFGFGSAVRRFQVKGCPLYDLGGEISNIMLLYEPVPGEEPHTGPSAGAA